MELLTVESSIAVCVCEREVKLHSQQIINARRLCMCIDSGCAVRMCANASKTGLSRFDFPKGELNIRTDTWQVASDKNMWMTYIGVSLVRLVRLSGTAPMLYLWFFFNAVRRVTLLVVLLDAGKTVRKKINFQL